MAKERMPVGFENTEKEESLPSFWLARLMDRVDALQSTWSEKPVRSERSDESAEEYRDLLKNAADAIEAVIEFNKRETNRTE